MSDKECGWQWTLGGPQINVVDNVCSRCLACAIELGSYFLLSEGTTQMAIQYLHEITIHGETLECQ